MPGYLTPDTIPAQFFCHRVLIPDSLMWIANVSGALYELASPEAWQEFGAVTPEQAAEAALDILLRYYESDCLIGSVFPYVTLTPPQGCLECDGAVYDRVDYPELYARLDTALIIDADTFSTPDLRDKFILAGGGAITIFTSAGESEVTLIDTQLPAHTHTTQAHSHTNTPHAHTEISSIPTIINGGLEAPAAASTPSPTSTGLSGVTIDPEIVIVDSFGSDEPHNNMPPYYCLKYCLVAR